MHALLSLLDALETDPSLALDASLPLRLRALDRLDAYRAGSGSGSAALQNRVLDACDRLEAINTRVYEALRDDIRAGRGAERLLGLARDLQSDLPPGAEGRNATAQPGDRYDALDELVSGVLRIGEPQAATAELTPDMVFYQPTPARHILAMLSRSGLGEGDVLIDLGAGLGHVPLLAAICTRAQAIGIELEPAYVACAREAASALHLANVRFIASDVRAADFSAGTVFHLYTPFKGEILRGVLARLREHAQRQAIRVCTFGPCTPVVAAEPWLRADSVAEPDRIVVFRSL